jgi:aspartate kinase
MRIFKFGGAAINSAERIQNVATIVKEHSHAPLFIVISAMGKTTNALEKVAEAFYGGNKDEALTLFEAVKEQHSTLAKTLLKKELSACEMQLADFFTEVEWLLHDKPVREFDYYYDQIVCAGELLSTCIVSKYLNETGLDNEWLDVRDIIRTDDNFRDAGIDWVVTKRNLDAANVTTGVTLTQGFIGATDANESTTLGREGSDYTAAVFANMLDAESVTIWKDVDGVMNADPKLFPNASLIPELNFNEVIEMAYYGAQVIHPKTIKPLQNKGIPLYVKSFIDPSLPGTVIHKKHVADLPAIIVMKHKQALVELHSKDFSFVGEKPMSKLYEIFGKLNIKPNLIQTGAVSLEVAVDDNDKVGLLAQAAEEIFDVMVQKDLSILTIRHYNDSLLEEMTRDKTIVLIQQTPKTVQVLFGKK